MDHLPIFLNVRDKHILIVGHGTIAARRADMALRTGARVTVVGPALGDDFHDIADHPDLTHQTRALTLEDVKASCLVYGATEDRELADKVHDFARQAKVPVNIADQPDKCSFIMPAVVDRSPFIVGISSGGHAPILARILKARLESLVPATYGRFALLAGKFRERVLAQIHSSTLRRRFWENVAEGPAADHLFAGDEARAEAEITKALDAASAEDAPLAKGEVYLVGAGPGDPDLLTFRALRLIQKADVVLHDRLIGEPILNLVRRDAERIYVGKMAKDHTMVQEDISKLLVKLAKQGKRVLRLKGGDPFIFGRGGEEIEELAREGIPFQVVPGITAAAGCAAYAGIPLTHRDHAQACVFVTGHGKDGVLELDWEVLLKPKQTVAIYMGLSTLPALMEQFIARGADPALPAAVICNGTRHNQQVVTGTLADLADKAGKAEMVSPALILVGSVVTLRDKLAWFNETPTETPEDKLVSASLPMNW